MVGKVVRFYRHGLRTAMVRKARRRRNGGFTLSVQAVGGPTPTHTSMTRRYRAGAVVLTDADFTSAQCGLFWRGALVSVTEFLNGEVA